MRWLYYTGAAMEGAGELQGADWSYSNAKAASPKPLVSAYDNHANVLKQLGRTGEALESFRAALELDPVRAQTW
jgi:tetratricopeptide (TPR) repeat protein